MTLDFNIGLGKLLRAKREAAGLSVRVAAEKLGISKTKVAYLEEGKNQSLSHDELHRICDLYMMEEGDRHYVTQSLPAKKVDDGLLFLITNGHPDIAAQILTALPESGSVVPHVAIHTLAQSLHDDLPAIRQWLDETDVPDEMLFVYPSRELQKVDTLRGCLRIAGSLNDDPTRYAKALAALDAAWCADTITAKALAQAVKDAIKTLAPELKGIE